MDKEKKRRKGEKGGVWDEEEKEQKDEKKGKKGGVWQKFGVQNL